MDVFEEHDLRLIMHLIDPKVYTNVMRKPKNNKFHFLKCYIFILKLFLVPIKIEEGFVHLKFDDEIKLELCKLLYSLCDYIVRYRIEAIISFCVGFVATLQEDQRRRYIELKEAVLPSAVMARKTKEFRCPARDQMQFMIKFKSGNAITPVSDEIKGSLTDFHDLLISLIKLKKEEEAEENPNDKAQSKSLISSVIKVLFSTEQYEQVAEPDENELALQKALREAKLSAGSKILIKNNL